VTKTSDNIFPKVILAEGAAPATPSSGQVKIYAKSDGLAYSKDDAGAETLMSSGAGATTDHNHTTGGGDGGDLDGARVGDFLEFAEASAPSTPASGFARIYVKSDGRVYNMDDAGTEYGPFDTAGGGGPLLYVDSLAVGATGDEFADMSGWTATGSVTNTLVTTNVYDATIQRLVFTTVASTDRYTKSAPDADFTAYLTMYGTDQEDLIGWGYVNTSGTGCGIAWRAGTVWSVAFSGWVFSSSPTQVWQDPPDWPIAASPYMGTAAQFRIARSGSDIIVAVSYDGGSTWLAVHTFSGGSPAGSKLWLLGDFLNPSTYRLNVGRLTVT
jgi:hypothetical protein